LSKHTLHVDFDYDFELIAIISSLRDYRLCWQINRLLHLDLTRKSDLEVTDAKKRSYSRFPLFMHDDEINFLRYYFIGNKSAGFYLIPELKQVDYFLMLRGDAAGNMKGELLQQLKALSGVEAVFDTPISNIRSKQHLIIE